MTTSGPFDELVLVSPAGDSYRITVSNTGILSTAKVVPAQAEPTGVKASFNSTTRVLSVVWNSPSTGDLRVRRTDNLGNTGETTRPASEKAYSFTAAIPVEATSVTVRVTLLNTTLFAESTVDTTAPAQTRPTATDVTVTTTANSANLTWKLNNGTTATAGRNGVDATGYGPWTSAPLTTTSQVFSQLVPNTTYTFTVTPTGGDPVVVSGKTLTETSTPPADPTPVPGTNPLAFKSMTSGQGVQDAANGKANAWIGRRVMGLYSHWGGDGKLWGIDVPDAEYGINSVARLGDYDLDAAPQRLISSWANAANGNDDAKWRADLLEAKNRWGNRQGKLYYRPWHEFNGDWFNWSVRSAADQVNFVKAWQRFAAIFRSVFAGDNRFVLVWSPNRDSKYGLDVKKCWPGDEFVDVIGIDYYDYALGKNGTDADWAAEYMRYDSAGSPVGIGAWIKFAADHGKPWTLPEWGEQFGDNLIFLQKMATVFENNRYTGTGSPAGKCLGISWHNLYAPGGTVDPNATSGNFLIQVDGQDYSGRPKASPFWRQWHQNATWLRTV